MPPTLYLIDGHALAYRMYFALTAGSTSQRWQTSKGEPTAGTYGFARELMRIMRQQTSERVFTEFTRLKKENPSGDFWAPGYLIMGGTKPHPPQLVKDYIIQIRQRQGIEKSRK